jgi:hypothetical protein
MQGDKEGNETTDVTALISDSCPVKVCVALPLLVSQSLAVASQAPETNTFGFGPKDKLYGIWLALPLPKKQ